MATDPTLALSLNLFKCGEHHSFLSDDSLITYLMQLQYQEDLPVIEPNRQITGKDRQKLISGFLPPLADLLLGSVLVEAGVGVHLGPFCAHPGPAVGCFVTINRLPRSSFR